MGQSGCGPMAAKMGTMRCTRPIPPLCREARFACRAQPDRSRTGAPGYHGFAHWAYHAASCLTLANTAGLAFAGGRADRTRRTDSRTSVRPRLTRVSDTRVPVGYGAAPTFGDHVPACRVPQQSAHPSQQGPGRTCQRCRRGRRRLAATVLTARFSPWPQARTISPVPFGIGIDLPVLRGTPLSFPLRLTILPLFSARAVSCSPRRQLLPGSSPDPSLQLLTAFIFWAIPFEVREIMVCKCGSGNRGAQMRRSAGAFHPKIVNALGRTLHGGRLVAVLQDHKIFPLHVSVISWARKSMCSPQRLRKHSNRGCVESNCSTLAYSGGLSFGGFCHPKCQERGRVGVHVH